MRKTRASGREAHVPSHPPRPSVGGDSRHRRAARQTATVGGSVVTEPGEPQRRREQQEREVKHVLEAQSAEHGPVEIQAPRHSGIAGT